MDRYVLGKFQSGRKRKFAERAAAILICIYIIFLSSAFAADTVYNITVDLPPAVVYNVEVSDILPQGLIYKEGTLAVTGASTSPSETVSTPNDGSQVVYINWSFGEVDNTADQDIMIQFEAIVANVASNQDGVSLVNRATLNFDGAIGTGYSTENDTLIPVTVVEPDLIVEKSAESPLNLQVGDTVTYSVNIYHSSQSNSDAFDVNLTDFIYPGMTYSVGTARILSGPLGTIDVSNTSELKWHFEEVNLSWDGSNQILLTFDAVITEVLPGDQNINCANLTWASTLPGNPETRDGSGGINDYYSNATIHLHFVNLIISKEDSPDPVIAGRNLTYTIHYNNMGNLAANNVIIKETYDPNTSFINNSVPRNDTSKDYQWTIGTLGAGESGNITLMVNVNETLTNGTLLDNKVNIICDEGAFSEDNITTTVIGPNIYINKIVFNSSNHNEVSSVDPGDNFYYSITLENIDQINATNVTVTDVLDNTGNLTYNASGTDPLPSSVSVDGKTLFWNASALGTEQFNRTEKVTINISVDLAFDATETELINRYKFSSDEINGEEKTLETTINHTLTILKEAEKEEYSPDDLVNYTITYSNTYNFQLNNTTIYDVLPIQDNPPGVEYVWSDPPPTSRIDNILIWVRGDLPQGEGGSINLTVRVKKRQEVVYEANGTVSGEGYVFSRKWLTTHYKPYNLVNYVNITADYWNPETEEIVQVENESSAPITVLDPGTEIKTVEHGSGSFKSDDKIQYNRLVKHDIEEESKGTYEFVGANVTIPGDKFIEMYVDMEAQYYPTSFSLPRNRSVNYTSRWSTEVSAKNRVTGASLHESYRYATLIDRESHFKLTNTSSLMEVDSQFEGVGHIGMLKKQADSGYQNAPTLQLTEDYVGSFSIQQTGTGAKSERSVSGEGFVSSDKRIGESQATYEYGTGVFEIDEIVSASENAIYKDMKAVHQPTSFKLMDSNSTWTNRSIKWEEATRSKTEGVSYIGEQIQSADYIYADIEARALNELHTDTNFSGTARYRAILKNEKEEHEVDEVYSGKYQITKKILFTGVPRYDHPHLSASKEAIQYPNSSKVKYLITITNDGNKALAPIYIRDTFPQGTSYINSSFDPTEITSSYVNWTLLHLSIGSNFTIELNLDVVDEPSNLINIVDASGQYNDQWISASAFSTIEYDWLSCCPVEIRVSKTAAVDPSDPYIIMYNITVENLENYTMVAEITDKLPYGLRYLSSSISPASYGPEYINWTLTDLAPGGNETIQFRSEATRNGTFINRVHVDAYAINGSDSASADALTTVVIGPSGQTSTEKILGWEVPDWDLNYTNDIADLTCEEWCLLFDEEVWTGSGYQIT